MEGTSMQGSVRKLTGSKGTTWSGVIELPRDPVTGRRQKRVSGRTRREVEEKLRVLAGKLDQPEHIEAEALTFGQFSEQFLEAAVPTLRPASVRRYQDMLRNHICPGIGHLRLQKLSPFDLQRLYADRLAYGLSATSVHHLHVMVYRVLKQAYRWGMVSRNVAELVDAPRRTFPEVVTWNMEQVATFFAVSDESDLAALWRLALLTGMLRGELLGLMWEDIDLERGMLAVRRTLSRGKGGDWVLGQPKTQSGRRAIALPESCVASLRKHRARQNSQRLKLGELWQDSGFVFTGQLGQVLHVNVLVTQFKRLIRQAVLPDLRFHDLRHTSATLLLAQGVHPKIVQERLGHADISMTLNRYSHVTPDMQRSAADTLDAVFTKVS
jgi:integrase